MAGKDSKPRISFIIGGLGKGGAEKQLLYMLQALEKQRVALQLLTLTEGEYYQESLPENGIKHVRIPPGNPAARIAHIFKAVRSFRPDFLQSSHFFSSFYAGIVGRLTGITSIGAIRNDLYQDLKSVGKAGPFVLKLPDYWLANSHNARENGLRMGLRNDHMHVIQNVIDLDDFDRKRTSPKDISFGTEKLHVITVARLMPVKRIERFISAVAQARRQVPAIEGIIVGGGPEEQRLRAAAAQAGFDLDQPDSGITFLGERDDIPQLMQQADIFLLTSDREGFPNVLLEAMASSLPVISTPAGETRDLIEDGINGFLVPYDDTEGMANCVVRMAQSPTLRRTLGNNGRSFVEKRFSFANLEQDMLEFYRKIAAPNSNWLTSPDNLQYEGAKLGKR